MDWITQHYQDILTIIGALYTIAVVVVKLTPTPKDDEVLIATANLKFIKLICKIFGLDITQGINIKDKETK